MRAMGGRILAALILAAVFQRNVDERSAAAFVRTLQQAVARDDRTAVAAMIRYPLTVFAGGVRIPVSDASDMVHSYNAVFSPALRLVIANATMRGRGAAPTSPIDIDAARVTSAGDAVQIEPVGGRLLITAIHAPLAAGSTHAPPATGSGRTTGGQPRRIAVAFGRIEHMGSLAAGQRDAYLLSGRKNQVLDVRVTGVRGRDVIFELTNARTHKAIDAKADGGVRTWVGRIPEDGDYRIDVVRLAARGPAQLLYTLVVSLR